MITRQISQFVRSLEKGYPVIGITGPRQSGKTTLARHLYPDKEYVSLENPSTQEWALEDPQDFLKKYEKGAILDEVQRAPKLFSYLQEIVDAEKSYGRFILTGSQQFGLLRQITQSLAGRIALVELLPFSMKELYLGDPPILEEVLFKGFYPPIHDRNLDPATWFANYLTTYVERDVRNLINVRDLMSFRRFIRLCSGRIGQLLNLSQLAVDAGITHNTAKAWLSILEASYIVHLLEPFHVNFNKRIIKTPKLYFWDIGLACHLLSIQGPEQLQMHPLRGQLFENFVIAELAKNKLNMGKRPNCYFWRDRSGNELDYLLDSGNKQVPLEIKSGKTLNSDFFRGLNFWKSLTQQEIPAFLVYGGDEKMVRKGVTIVPWRDISDLNL